MRSADRRNATVLKAQLLMNKPAVFAVDTALVADSEDKLCRVVSEFGTVCERKKVESECG